MVKSVKLMAREAMMRHGYDPIDELVQQAQAPEASTELRRDVACVLLPYMYPKLAQVTLENESNTGAMEVAQSELMQKILQHPELADAAQRLSLAAADAALEREFPHIDVVAGVQ